MKVLKFIIDLPFRFVFALIGFTFCGWIGWVGIVLIALKLFGVIGWPWWVAALPLEYGVLYCLYMTIDGALYRAGWKDVGGYARFTTPDVQLAYGKFEREVENIKRIHSTTSDEEIACAELDRAVHILERTSGKTPEEKPPRSVASPQPLPAVPNAAEADAEEMKKRGNYIGRHWRGQLSLGVSYWVNGFLATIAVSIVAGVVASIDTDLRTHSVLVLLVFAFAIVATTWQLFGVWRSASNHFARGGTHFWAGVAKVMVILGTISTVGIIWGNYIPQSAELFSIIAGDTGIPAYQIQVLPGGTEIEFRGGLRAGSAKELDRILSAVPRAKVLHIESPGGRIAEAKRMMELVHQHNFTTYTSEYCLSAATLVLMSGKERVIAANAKVGFHAGSFPGLTPEQQREADLLLRTTMHSAGVSQQFIDRVVATPPEQMWYPSFDEMRANGVITGESFGDRFAVSWAQSDEELEQVVNKIGEQPQFRTLREVDPVAYARMMDEFKAAIKSGKSEREALASADEFLREVAAQRQQQPTAVVQVSANDTLNVRADASADSAVIATLRAGDHVFLQPGRSVNSAKGIPVTWQKITTATGLTGWVNADYISLASGTAQ